MEVQCYYKNKNEMYIATFLHLSPKFSTIVCIIIA